MLRERRLELLQACFNQRRPYLPDFLTPVPAGCDEDLDADLHQVATTSAGRVRAELDVLATTAAGGAPGRRAGRLLPGHPRPRVAEAPRTPRIRHRTPRARRVPPRRRLRARGPALVHGLGR
ncbi:hypothetical protein [Catenulispora pinisilvae]|uniref:hypothetical protein n=1 Tax=Catenulispora pinisilvae TaxID=2705253 RepID=UPI0018928092|nr:hypothetical protein [Catenulispora pinisilvae]